MANLLPGYVDSCTSPQQPAGLPIYLLVLCFYPYSYAQPTGYRIDLVVFAESRWLREMGSICEVVDLNEVARGGGDEDDEGEGGEGGGGGSYAQLRRHGNESTCFVVPYPRPPEVVWQVGVG